jgi:hypothetical protein
VLHLGPLLVGQVASQLYHDRVAGGDDVPEAVGGRVGHLPGTVRDGMFRERSGGAPNAVIHTEMNIGIGSE